MKQAQAKSLDYVIGLLNGTFDDVYKVVATPDLSHHTDDQMAIDQKN